MIRSALCLLWLWLAVSGAATASPLAAVTARTVTGATVKPFAAAGRRATVLLFVAHDCPVSNGYAPEFTRICRLYGAQKIAFYVVYVESDLTAAAARAHAHDYGYVCPALLDPEHRLVKLAAATVTPEVAVYMADGQRIYRGRIDNRYAGIGKRREVVTAHDLRDVLESVIGGKAVAAHETTAIGCFIQGL